jgi:class 3 adenylate cyclase
MLWAFWRLYFRSKSKLALVPVFTYLALIPLFLASVLSNELAKITIGFAKYTDIHFALAFIAGIGFSFVSFRESKRHHWTAFRKNVCLFYAIASAVLAVTFVVRFLILSGNLEQSTLIHFAGFLEFARLALVGFTILSGVAIFMEWAIIVRDRQVVLKKFGRMVDPRLMNEIIRGPEQRSERLERVTVMVVDLRAFTELCEKYDPEIVMEALNQYLSLVTAIVRSHGGVVDKFVGDSVVAYWGAPSRGENDEISAVRAAVDVRVSLVALNRERIRKQSFPLSVGIGLHCGAAIFGPVGAIDRVDYTVIGGAINIASRLQSLTKAHDFDILVSDNLYQLTTASAFVEEIGPVKIRGIAQMISIHKLIGVDMGERGFVIGSQSLESSYLGRSPGKLAKPQSILPLARPADFSAITDEDDEQAA